MPLINPRESAVMTPDQQVRKISELMLLILEKDLKNLRCSPKQMCQSIIDETNLLSRDSSLIRKNDPYEFIDIGFMLLVLPPDMAHMTALSFSDFKSSLGYDPMSNIMTSIGRSISFCSGGVSKRLLKFREIKTIDDMIHDQNYRAVQAANFLSRTIFVFLDSLEQSRVMYHQSSIDPLIRQCLDTLLMSLAGEKLATQIIKK